MNVDFNSPRVLTALRTVAAEQIKEMVLPETYLRNKYWKPFVAMGADYIKVDMFDYFKPGEATMVSHQKTAHILENRASGQMELAAYPIKEEAHITLEDVKGRLRGQTEYDPQKDYMRVMTELVKDNVEVLHARGAALGEKMAASVINTGTYTGEVDGYPMTLDCFRNSEFNIVNGETDLWSHASITKENIYAQLDSYVKMFSEYGAVIGELYMSGSPLQKFLEVFKIDINSLNYNAGQITANPASPVNTENTGFNARYITDYVSPMYGAIPIYSYMQTGYDNSLFLPNGQIWAIAKGVMNDSYYGLIEEMELFNKTQSNRYNYQSAIRILKDEDVTKFRIIYYSSMVLPWQYRNGAISAQVMSPT